MGVSTIKKEVQVITGTANTGETGAFYLNANINNYRLLACYIRSYVTTPYLSGAGNWFVVVRDQHSFELIKNTDVSYTALIV